MFVIADEFVSHLRNGNRKKTCSHEVARFLHYTKPTFLCTSNKLHSKGVSSYYNNLRSKNVYLTKKHVQSLVSLKNCVLLPR